MYLFLEVEKYSLFNSPRSRIFHSSNPCLAEKWFFLIFSFSFSTQRIPLPQISHIDFSGVVLVVKLLLCCHCPDISISVTSLKENCPDKYVFIHISIISGGQNHSTRFFLRDPGSRRKQANYFIRTMVNILKVAKE